MHVIGAGSGSSIDRIAEALFCQAVEEIESVQDRKMLAERMGFWINVEAVRCEPDGFQPRYRIYPGHCSLFELSVERILTDCYRSEQLAMSAGLAAAEEVIEKGLAEYVQKFSPDRNITHAPGVEIG